MGVDAELADDNTSVVILGPVCGRAGPVWATSAAVKA